MVTTQQGVDTNDDGSFDSNGAANAFLDSWQDAGLLSNDSDDGDNNEDDDASADDVVNPEDDTKDADGQSNNDDSDDELDNLDLDEEEEGDEGEDDAEPAQAVAPDEAVVKITVDGEDHEVSVKDLKRLYGQEASLTRKSQEVSVARTNAEREGERFVAAGQTLLQAAEQRLAPFAQIDWVEAQVALTPTQFLQLRQNAKAAFEEYEQIETTVGQTMGQFQQEREQRLQVEAAKAIETLGQTIPKWSKEKYNEIVSFAVEAGMAPEIVNSLVDPVAIKIIHDAMLLKQARERSATKRKVTSPTRVLTKTKGRAAGTAKSTERKALINKATNGRGIASTADEGANLFLANWAAE